MNEKVKSENWTRSPPSLSAFYVLKSLALDNSIKEVSYARRPLEGIRVTDLTWAWAGPYCTLQMAHMGAEVIRIESQKRPCVSRLIPSFADDVPGPNRAGYFNQYSQGKKSLQLDLSLRPEALEIDQKPDQKE